METLINNLIYAIKKGGSYPQYANVLVANKNTEKNLATRTAYKYFMNLGIKITQRDVFSVIQRGVPLSASLLKTTIPPITIPAECTNPASSNINLLTACSCLEATQAYVNEINTYNDNVEKWTSDDATWQSQNQKYNQDMATWNQEL